MLTQLKNSTLLINNQTVTLLDDRVVDGCWVDTEHLGEPVWQRRHNISNEWFEPEIDFLPENAEPDRIRQAARFKQPDMMELVWEYQAKRRGIPSLIWVPVHSELLLDDLKQKGRAPLRQIFILKDQEQEPEDEYVCGECGNYYDGISCFPCGTGKYDVQDKQVTKGEERLPTIESVFNKHSWNALGAISPSKDFCLLAMKEWSEIETKRISDALDFNVKTNINLMKKLVSKFSSLPSPKSEGRTLEECKDEVAKRHNYIDWQDYINMGQIIGSDNDLYDEVFKLYAKSQTINREQECKTFAGWIMNQVIAGRTLENLWIDYLTES